MLKLLPALIVAVLAFGASILNSVSVAAAPALIARTSDMAGVRVVVTPRNVSAGVSVWEFEIAMDTHTKPLNDDLARVTVLADDSGRRYTPTAWQGDPQGGHHRKGVLQFSAPGELPNAIELRMEGIGGGSARVFRWELR